LPDQRPVALITGASAGIGAVFAEKLAARGFDLILLARRADRLHDLAARMKEKHGIACRTLEADLARDEGLQAAVEAVNACESLDLLVNNAGFGTRGFLYEAPTELQERMHRLHVLATMRLTQAALRSMVQRARGGIINVSSVASFMQTPGNVSYCSTKGWMTSFTEGIAMELKMTGSPVKVQALCPGFTVTEFHEVMGVGRGHAPGKWWMSAEEVVEASLHGLDRGKWLVVPGTGYKIIVWLMGVLPRRLKWWIALRRSRELYTRRGGRM